MMVNEITQCLVKEQEKVPSIYSLGMMHAGLGSNTFMRILIITIGNRLLRSRTEAAELMKNLRELHVENIDQLIEFNDWVIDELNSGDQVTEHHSGCQKYKSK
eukprot:Blabericola_migrator_1__2841@NODE_1811_length_3754_cov_41_873068_g1165_i0_p2_GENE_NODE_1811_length_3754_cov_41_873068_g1165_i0NODE_1811_length_3754_cov_41_873068_g1165_i0_p2_ORF_typecomplete_len103_score15_61DUF5420/PF17457_2/0_028_NODE_1811_length_3754_cov_41_873068_g1165_i010981406